MRSIAGRYAAWCAEFLSVSITVSCRVFSGAWSTISASISSITRASYGAGVLSSSSGACRIHSVAPKRLPDQSMRSSAYAPRSAIVRSTSSSSGRASGDDWTSTCQPGWTPTQVSTSSSAY